MFETAALFGIAATIIGFIGQGYYIHGMLRGQFVPHAFTSLLYALLSGTALAAQLSDNAGHAIWVMLFTVTFHLFLCLYSYFKFGIGYIVRADWYVLLGCLGAIPLWILTNTPLYSVIFITIIDIAATLPALRKAWVLPHEDSIFAWFIGGFKFLLGLPATQNFSLINVLYPTALIIINIVVMFILWYRRRVITKPTA